MAGINLLCFLQFNVDSANLHRAVDRFVLEATT